jgi:hypothetical protein
LPDGSTVVPVIHGSGNTMLSMLSADNTPLVVDLSIGVLSKENRSSGKMNRLILICLLLKCSNRPKTHTTMFAYLQSNATMLRALEEPGKSGIAGLRADGRTRHAFPQIESFP